MITAKKARELANGVLNWWEKNKKQRRKREAFLTCYRFHMEIIDEKIKKGAKHGYTKLECDAPPQFYKSFDMLLLKPVDLSLVPYTEQLEIYQLAISKIESDLRKIGYKVHIEGSKWEGYKDEYFRYSGLVDVKYRFYISWE